MPLFAGFIGEKPINKRIFENPRTADAPFPSPKVRSKKLKKKKVRTTS
jgi:hypothetical protein